MTGAGEPVVDEFAPGRGARVVPGEPEMVAQRGELARRIRGTGRIRAQPHQVVDLRQPAEVVRAEPAGHLGLARPQHVRRGEVQPVGLALPDRVELGDLVRDRAGHGQLGRTVGDLDAVAAVRRRRLALR